MKNTLFTVVLVMLSALSFAQNTNVTKGKLYAVSTMKQFLEVLGSDRTIELEADFFFLPKNMENALVLKNVKNLTIQGYGDKPVRFVTPYGNVPVITFEKSSRITLKNLEVGHALQRTTTCDGHVLRFVESKDINIENCFLFGSGFLGISAEKTKNMKVTQTTIRGCTGKILALSNCKNVIFENCTFTDNIGTSEMISFHESEKISLTNCEISLNRMEYNIDTDAMRGSPIFAATNCKSITATTCTIVGNSTPYLFLDTKGIRFSKDCTIHSNAIHVKDVKLK